MDKKRLKTSWTMDKQLCDLFLMLIKQHKAHIQMQVGFPQLDECGNETVDVIAEYDDEILFNQLLNEATNKRILIEESYEDR